jgi:hypothetical protein
MLTVDSPYARDFNRDEDPYLLAIIANLLGITVTA